MNLSRKDLKPYQTQAVDIIKKSKYHAFWMTPGKGKTIVTLTALADLFDVFEIGQVLIIAPLRVIKSVWPVEIKIWEHTRHLSFNVLHGKNKEKKAKQYKHIHLINREMVVWLANLHENKWPYDTVVIDESQSFKNSSSKRFKILKKTRHLFSRAYELTGSPASNGYLNVWAQIFLLDRGERLERNLTAYKNKYFTSNYNGYGWSHTIIPGAKKVIQRKIKDVVLTVNDDDYKTNEKPLFHNLDLKLPDKLMNAYRDFEKHSLLEYESKKTIEALSAGALKGKLLQFCNGAVYETSEILDSNTPLNNPKNRAFKEFHQIKLDALQELIDEFQEEPLLISYSFVHDFVRIKKRFPTAVSINDKNAIERWNSGKISILTGHPASMGHGLNLQHGGHNLVFFGFNTDWDLYHQTIRRLARQGQKKRVNVYHIKVLNTVEGDLIPVLKRKKADEKDLMAAMRRGIQKRMQ